MHYSHYAQLELARGRQDDFLREADHARLVRALRDDRPGALSRLRSHLARKRQPHPRPLTA